MEVFMISKVEHLHQTQYTHKERKSSEKREKEWNEKREGMKWNSDDYLRD